MKLPASFAYCFPTGTHHGKAIGWNSEREREPNECTRKLPSNAQEKLDEIMGIGQHGNMQQKNDKNEISCDFTCVHDSEPVRSRDSSANKRALRMGEVIRRIMQFHVIR